MSDTPETDEIRGQYERDYISIGKILEHSEELERERNQAIAELAKLKEHVGLCHDALGECRASDTSELHTYFSNHRDAILRYREAIAERDELATHAIELAGYANESLETNQKEFLEGLFERIEKYAQSHEKIYGDLSKPNKPKN